MADAIDSPDPFQLVVIRLRDLGRRYKHRSPDQIRAQCPAHQPDRDPSLVVTRANGRVLLKCHAGCPQSAVVKALGLRMDHLFSEPTQRKAPQIVATYDYCDLHGEILARKVRTDLKTFRWQTPQGDGWRPGLHGQTVGMYRLADLVDERHVLKVEGEKAVDRLWSLGLPATCGPHGASQWLDAWTEMLWRTGCHDVIILPDHDAAGQRHAQQVANSCHGFTPVVLSDDPDRDAATDWTPDQRSDALLAPLRVKVVELPNLRPGQDVVDYLDGHHVLQLRQLLADAPYWYPGADEAQRLARKREQGRKRAQAFRNRHRPQSLRRTA